jgi:regulator of cell morphogenesis and NO signaling
MFLEFVSICERYVKGKGDSMSTVIDLTNFEPRARNALIMSLFEGLRENSSFEFINDENPERLCQDIDSLHMNNLKWEFSEHGPDAWKIRISKQQKTGCCGMCGGHN